jgi:hypothetical protein
VNVLRHEVITVLFTLCAHVGQMHSCLADTDQMESGNQLLFFFWNRPLKQFCCIQAKIRGVTYYAAEPALTRVIRIKGPKHC